ncbi:succinate-semialdehyde dehydrogenase/glutarate-semialdehyde dehydrogenase [Scopulibacillus darangshiensis]|uniref:Aldehyde dehydrogenase n=1 Tax=Scopulibacillus darangshiensis TaxID=442528 RepID=A0A4V2SNE9_9BACL|nr:NAD-dependent succinate-semialdehyde dehydrogenase [Scopulibacillus darangshiensis]TCP30886.1 succinate-semialdehyde dehydrogenase/glutarate-semialdehyde dehydrogenase [Scopulibacillus darangshiensis]
MSIAKTVETFKLYIDGEWNDPATGEYFDVVSPATGEVLFKAANGNRQDVKKAIEASCSAFQHWSKKSGKERSTILFRLYQLMLENTEELAKTISSEMGKPIKQARGEVANSAEYVLWNAEEGKRVYGQTIQGFEANKRLQMTKQPVGPVAAITPWNFPLAMITRKLSPALAAGCTVILKPAEQTPGTAVKFFELAEEAGIPKGVINLVTGQPAEIGDALLSDKRIRKITFTGSTKVGKLLLEKAAHQVKRVSMELGGHAPFIVFEDADLDKAVSSVMKSKYFNCGQTCISPNRLYVQESIKETFLDKLKAAVEGLTVGNGLNEEVGLGPVVSKAGLDKVKSHVKDAQEKGARLVCGGEEYQVRDCEEGFFYTPTILSDVNEKMRISYEETFGPVAPIFTFKNEDEVVNKANDTDYGLAAYMFTKDLARSVRVSESLEYGMVGINDTVLSQVQGPFGGIKESGMGREGGPNGLDDFLETKFISTVI